jgi:prevent-host-death family protein
MKSVTTHEAKTHLSALLKEVEQGEEVLIRRGNTPIAKLLRVDSLVTDRRPRTGTITSRGVRYERDAFEPLDRHGMEELGLL